MKKIIIGLGVLFSTLIMINDADALCLQCPEIQKELKKEIKLTKEQTAEIKNIKKEMKVQLKSYDKEYKANQKKINKILDQDNPDIAKMMDYKRLNSKVRLDIMKTKRETYSKLFEVYTEEQQETAKRILSENYGIETKGKCDFCDNKSANERSHIKFKQEAE